MIKKIFISLFLCLILSTTNSYSDVDRKEFGSFSYRRAMLYNYGKIELLEQKIKYLEERLENLDKLLYINTKLLNDLIVKPCKSED